MNAKTRGNHLIKLIEYWDAAGVAQSHIVISLLTTAIDYALSVGFGTARLERLINETIRTSPQLSEIEYPADVKPGSN